MSEIEDLPENTMMMVLKIEDGGEMSIMCGTNIKKDMPEETAEYLSDMMTGLFLSFENMIDQFAYIGNMARFCDEMAAEGEIEFEPDENLLKAIRDSKVIPFDKKKLN